MKISRVFLAVAITILGAQLTQFQTDIDNQKTEIEFCFFEDMDSEIVVKRHSFGTQTTAQDGSLDLDINALLYDLKAEGLGDLFYEIHTPLGRISPRLPFEHSLSEDHRATLRRSMPGSETAESSETSEIMDDLVVGLELGFTGEDLNFVGNKFGLGTATPASKLTVVSTDFDDHLLVQRSGAPDGHLSTSTGGWVSLWPGSGTDYNTKGIRLFDSGVTRINNLSGSGSRMVVANADGDLSTMAIPGGTITGSGTATRVAFWDGATSLSSNSNLYWNNATSSLGIGTTSPSYRLDVAGDTRTTGKFFGNLNVEDTRSVDSPPTSYNKEMALDFKYRSTVGVGGSGTYSGLITIAPWGDDSGDMSHQLNLNNGGLFWRTGWPNSSSWGSWNRIWTQNTDGSGSGLDADLLDGLHSSSFAGVGHTHAILTAGTGLSGSSYNGSTPRTWSVDFGNSSTGGTRAQGNFGQFNVHSTYTDFNTTPGYWGWNYVQSTTNAPNGLSSQWYRNVVSLGADYPARGSGGYSMELAFPRYNHSTAGVWMRTIENGSIGGWTRIDGGAAVSGSGTANYLPKWSGGTSLNNSAIYQDGSAIAIGTTDAETHGLNVEYYNDAAIRGADQNGSNIYAEGMLGVLTYSGLPTSPTNIGVLGIKTNNGSSGVGVYAWNNQNYSDNLNYAIYANANGVGSYTNYGIYSTASGGGTNWAGYFNGNVNITGNLTVSGSVPGDNLGNHTATTTLNMTNHIVDNAIYYDVTAANGYGVRFWGSDSYKIHMGNAAENHYGPVTDYSIKMNMNNQAGRGWTWGVEGATPVAALEATAGNYQIAGYMSFGGTNGIVHHSNTGTKGQASGWTPPNSAGQGVWLESGYSEGGGFYADGNVACIWSPDYGIRFYDEDVLPGGSHNAAVENNGYMTSPRFQDIDNTGYYVDPASTTNLYRIQANADIYNAGWYRGGTADNGYVRLYGNTRQMVFRTDGTSQYSDNGSYPFVWLYGGDSSGNRRMILNSSGQLWLSNYGWLHDYIGSHGDNLGDHTATTTLNMNNNQLVVKPNVTVDSGNTGIHWHGAGDFSYAIYQESGSWTSPYPDMMIRFHTGLKLSADSEYGGVKIYAGSAEEQTAQFDNNGLRINRTNLYFDASNPYIYSGGSYVVIPNGLYVSGGTAYIQNSLRTRGYIQNDGSSYSGYVRIEDDLHVANWVRTDGSSGIYFQSYGGGWHMTDGTWIRAYNNKPVYADAEIRSGNNMRAPIFYDLNSSSYYLDPNSTSNLYQVRARYYRDNGGGYLLNAGSGISISEQTDGSYTISAIIPCDHEIRLYDTYGDGWNGGSVDVYVDGVLVINDGTLSSGYGPATYTFSAASGSSIQVYYTAGGWAYENYYDVISGGGSYLVNDWYPSSSGTWTGTGNCSSLMRRIEEEESAPADNLLSRMGTAQLREGRAAIAFDRVFSSNIGDGSPTVVVTPLAPATNLYVSDIDSTGFKVIEHEGSSSVSFNWIAMIDMANPTGYDGVVNGNEYRDLKNSFLSDPRKNDYIEWKRLFEEIGGYFPERETYLEYINGSNLFDPIGDSSNDR